MASKVFMAEASKEKCSWVPHLATPKATGSEFFFLNGYRGVSGWLFVELGFDLGGFRGVQDGTRGFVDNFLVSEWFACF